MAKVEFLEMWRIKHRLFTSASSWTCFPPWDISIMALTQFTICEEEKEGKGEGGKG